MIIYTLYFKIISLLVYTFGFSLTKFLSFEVKSSKKWIQKISNKIYNIKKCDFFYYIYIFKPLKWNEKYNVLIYTLANIII